MDDYEDYENGGLLRDRYKKIGDISEGSYGMVSVAKDLSSVQNKLVAVKYIYPIDYKKKQDLLTNSKSRPSSSPAKLKSPQINRINSLKPSKESILKTLKDEAQKEIRIHKILGKHPNISTLYDHFDSFLILEFCSRGDLYEAIQNNNGPSTSHDVKDVFLQIINALEYCHSHNVYHRDLKPENILIAEDWSIKLCDWGLATTTKIITNKDEFDIGSERYMAPELFDNDIESYDASKIDLWSIGIILLTLVFHKNPFQVANYSDKRFAQFVNNREALFDIFSTMSADMFTILRYSLNIDPENRDLANIKSELLALKFFTIDEEYWVSELDDEEEEEEEYLDSEEDDNRYFAREDPMEFVSVSPTKQIPIVTKTDYSPTKIDTNQDSLSPSAVEPELTSKDDKPQILISNTQSSGVTTMPHNHRADALLSTNTSMKPIPIGGSNMKFIRNTRKPFNVASFNQSHNGKFHSGNGTSSNNYRNFNREDFFTPKSVFNHYMDKYGEQRFQNSDRGYNNNGGNNNNNNLNHNYHHNHNNNNNGNWKRNNRKPRRKHHRKYKQRNGIAGTRLNENGSANSVSNTIMVGNSNSYVESERFNRRKSALYKLKKAGFLSNSTNASIPSAPTGTAVSANLCAMNGSYPGVNGKYIPPYLRSPNYMRSPVIEPLTEEIEKLSLSRDEDLDEVFHLEDDFDYVQPVKTDLLLSESTADFTFKRANCKNGSNSDESTSHDGKYNSSGSNVPNTNCRKSVGVNRRPLSSSHNVNESASLGKYVPPFRRGSHLSASQKTKIKNPTLEDRFDPARFLNDDINSDGEWLEFKKDWSDYD